MARPIKPRNICRRQEAHRFEAGNDAPAVDLASDEMEALRLSDLEELDQVEASARMGISRGTLQRLLYSAHRKLAFALVAARSIAIVNDKASDSKCCSGRSCRFCPQKINRPVSIPKGDSIMIIAVASENGEVFQHFGHTPEFTLFDIQDNLITAVRQVPTGEIGHGALAGFLAENAVELLICGGIGGGAQMALAESGVKLVAGVQGDVIEAVRQYLTGTLKTDPDFTCHHHNHEAGHSCSSHGCGGTCH